MDWQWWVTTGIAVVALAVAVGALVVSWLAHRENVRMRRRLDVAFVIEHAGGPKYKLRHTGRVAIERVRVERGAFEEQPEMVLPPMPRMEPGESTDMYVTGDLPDTVTVRWGGRGRAVIPFPAPAATS